MGGISAGSGLIGANASANAAESASAAQVASAQLGIDEQRRQFNKIQQLLSPYVRSGTDASNAMADMVGLNGREAERSAMRGIELSPEFAALNAAGENAILQNASATGGLRGGNVQGALAENRQGVLSGLTMQRYGQLGGLAGAGQASAAMQAQAGQAMGTNIAGLRGDQGAAQAGGALAAGNAFNSGLGAVAGSFGSAYGNFNAGQAAGTIPADASFFGSWGL